MYLSFSDIAAWRAKLSEVAAQTDFEPTFTVVDGPETCADQINIHHEDYPRRVPATKEALEIVFEMEQAGLRELRWQGARSIQGFIMEGSNAAGHLRTINTMPAGGDAPYLDVIFLSEYVEHLFPIHFDYFDHEYEGSILEHLTEWYKAFQFVHPFEDGNGRTGGVIVAIIFYTLTGKWLAPNQ